MRTDYQLLYDQVRDALRHLDACVADPKYYPAHLLRVARLLFEDPLGAITKEARTHLFKSSIDARKAIGEAFAREKADRLEIIAQNLTGYSVHPSAQSKQRAALEAVEKLKKAVSGGLSLDHHLLIRDVTELVNLLGANQPTNVGLATATTREAQEFAAAAKRAMDLMNNWGEVADAFDVSSSLEKFEVFYRDTVAILEEARLPSKSPPDVGALRELLWPVRILTSEVMRALVSRPQVHRSVMRLRVFLESFAKEDLLVEMEARAGETRQNERVLQRTLDRFLFGEGLFPLTHFTVAGGLVDTFFEQRLPAGLAEITGISALPALIELKQAISLTGEPATGKSDVKNAVRAGLQQADIYRSHLQVEWASHAVYVVVAYNGPTRYVLREPDDRVVLAYLGEKTPSETKTVLDLNA